MFPGNRRYTLYMNPISELDCDCECHSDTDPDTLISNVINSCHNIHAIVGPCDLPGCPFCRPANNPLGNTLQGPSTRGGSLLPQGSASRGGTLFPQSPATRGGSVFPQGRATRGGSVLPSLMNPRKPGYSNAESRYSSVRGATARDWSRADEGRYGRSAGGETRRGPIGTGRGRRRGLD